MIGKRAFSAFTVATALVFLGAASAAAQYDARDRVPGGFVKPCSLDGVNPVYHPDIFGNPAFAHAVYGFVRSRDGAWRVERNCERGPHHN
jgi:hypothetical protein